MLEGKSLKSNPINVDWFSNVDNDPFGDWLTPDPAPGLLSGKDWARRAVAERTSMIRMRMRYHDRGRIKMADLPSPVVTAVDHDTPAMPSNQERGMHPVPRRSDFDISTGSKERQLHRANPMLTVTRTRIRLLGQQNDSMWMWE